MSKLPSVRQSEYERMRRRLGFAFLALLLLMFAGTVGYKWIGGPEHGFIDAFYMTVITLTTVGYTEVINLEGNDVGRIFTVVLLVGGMGIVAYAVPLLAAFLIEGHFLNVFTRRRMQKSIDAMSDHYIVCGATPSSMHVAEELIRTHRDVVLVVPTTEDLEQAVRLFDDISGVVGDASDDEILERAGIRRATGIVASVGSDKDNVIVALTARRLAPDVRIVSAAEQPQNAGKMRTAGANAIVDPGKIGGLRMASELVRPTVVSFLDRMLRDEDASLRVEEVVVPDDAPNDRTLEALDIPAVSGALVLAVVLPGESRFEFNPRPEHVIVPGSILVVMTTAVGREKLQAHLTR